MGYVLELVGSSGRGQNGDDECGPRARRHCGSHPHRIHMASTRAHSTPCSSMEPLHYYLGLTAQATEGRAWVIECRARRYGRAACTEGLPPIVAPPPRNHPATPQPQWRCANHTPNNAPAYYLLLRFICSCIGLMASDRYERLCETSDNERSPLLPRFAWVQRMYPSKSYRWSCRGFLRIIVFSVWFRVKSRG